MKNVSHNISPIAVLVVDDEKMIRELLGETLEAIGYKVLTAEDHKQAIGVLKSEKIDVVITDVVLPDKSGIDLIKALKEGSPQLPVLAISGKGVPEQSVLEAGADGFLAKPFRIGKVEELIEKTLRHYDSITPRLLPARKKILVVDDEQSILTTLIESLDALGYQADGVKDGNEALETINNNNYDLIITDIMMPRLNGIQLLQSLKAKYPDLPVVIITGYPLAYPPQKAIQEGASGYIAKPFRINQIDKLLGKILYNYEVKES